MNRTLLRSVPALAVSLALAATPAPADDNGCKAAYDDGRNVADVAKCEAAARAGGPNAEFEYGLVLWSGYHGTLNRKAALDWFRLSARQGHYLAQVMLGKMLSDPRIDADLRNPVEGYAWYIAADAPKAAAKVLAILSGADAEIAQALGPEYKAKYGATRPAKDGA